MILTSKPQAVRIAGLGSATDTSSILDRAELTSLEATSRAGVIAPFFGDGQAMALRSAVLLARLILQFPAQPAGDDFLSLGRRWDRIWQREFALRMRLGRWLQPLLMRRATAEAAIRVVESFPSLGRVLVRATRGRTPRRGSPRSVACRE